MEESPEKRLLDRKPRSAWLNPEAWVLVVCGLFMIGFFMQLAGGRFEHEGARIVGEWLKRPFILYGGGLVLLFIAGVSLRAVGEMVRQRREGLQDSAKDR